MYPSSEIDRLLVGGEIVRVETGCIIFANGRRVATGLCWSRGASRGDIVQLAGLLERLGWPEGIAIDYLRMIEPHAVGWTLWPRSF